MVQASFTAQLKGVRSVPRHRPFLILVGVRFGSYSYLQYYKGIQVSWKASGAAKALKLGAHGEKLNMADKLVLMVISDDYNEARGCGWSSQQLLAEECLCTPRGLRGILDRLEQFGLLVIEHRGRLGNRYRLPFHHDGLRNTVPYEKSTLRNEAVNIEERHVGLEEPAGSSQPLVEPTNTEPPQNKCKTCGEIGPHVCKSVNPRWELQRLREQKKIVKLEKQIQRERPVYESASDRRAREAREQVARVAERIQNYRGRGDTK